MPSHLSRTAAGRAHRRTGQSGTATGTARFGARRRQLGSRQRQRRYRHRFDGRPASAATATATATACGLAAVGMWGLAPVATRALVLQLAPLPLLVLRMAVAAVVLLPWCVPVLRRLDRAAAGRLVTAGLLGMVGYMLPVTVGIQWLPASTAALILATEPVWIMSLGRVFLGERVPGWSWAGSASPSPGSSSWPAPARCRPDPADGSSRAWPWWCWAPQRSRPTRSRSGR